MSRSADDTRPVPTPFGWCSECIREGVWLRALTLWQGNALCGQHVVALAGPGQLDIPNGTHPREYVLDRLREGIREDRLIAGF